MARFWSSLAVNALRGHMAEFGKVVPQGPANTAKLVALVEDPDSGVPELADASPRLFTETLLQHDKQIHALDAAIARRAGEDETARRPMTIRGVDLLMATALVALATSSERFRRGHDIAAWLGLTPRQHSTCGKQRLGATTKMGEQSLRRLLIIGANCVVQRRTHKGAVSVSWLAGMQAPAEARRALEQFVGSAHGALAQTETADYQPQGLSL